MREQKISMKKLEAARGFRREGTATEQFLWEELRGRRLNGYKFRSQMPVAGYIVDFCCLDKRLIVEVDGPVHADQMEQDARRTHALEEPGFRVIRFSNRMIEEEIDEVLKRIAQALS